MFSTLFPYLLLMYCFIFKIVCLTSIFFIPYFVYIFCNSSYFVHIFCNFSYFVHISGNSLIEYFALFCKSDSWNVSIFFVSKDNHFNLFEHTHTVYFVFCLRFLCWWLTITDASLTRSNVPSSARWPEPWPAGAHDAAAATDASCCPVLRPLGWADPAAAGPGHPQEGEGRYPGAAPCAPWSGVHRVVRQHFSTLTILFGASVWWWYQHWYDAMICCSQDTNVSLLIRRSTSLVSTDSFDLLPLRVLNWPMT